MVLLIVLVLLGSTVVVVLGASAISDAQSDTRIEAAQHQLQRLDAELSALSGSDARQRVEFDAATELSGDYRIDRSGYVNVTVDATKACSFQQELTSVIFEDSQGRTVGYEAGGVWRAGLDGSTALSTPDVTFEDGTLDVSIVNLTGHVDRRTNVARKNVTATRNRSASFAAAVRQGECVRPDNVTIWVKSRFQTGWHNYLESEIGVPAGNVRSFSNGTVKVFVPQNTLHPSTDDRTNHVVDLRHVIPGTDVPYMVNVTLEGRPGTDGPVTVNVSKDAGNTYSAFIEPLTDDSLDIGRAIEIAGTDVAGPPLDVAIIMDESGSMRFDANGGGDCGFSGSDWNWCPDPKSDAAIDAAKRFVGALNDSRDRVGVVGYNSSGYYHRTDGLYFTRDLDAANDTLENDVHASGSTRIDRGMDFSNAIFDFKGNESRTKFAIMLTDGKNHCGGTPCDANSSTERMADIAAKRDITVFTVGYGADENINETLLKLVADRTGGQYYQATDADALAAVFEDIGRRIKPRNAIASTPITSNVSAGGQLFDADIPGDTSHIATVNSGAGEFLNVNDPTAPTLFSHSFPHADDEDFHVNLTSYDCKPGAWELTGDTRVVNGSRVHVARCTDIGAENRSFGAHVYVDGERPTQLLQTTYASWQQDVNDSLDAFPGVTIDSSTGDLEARSNQAIIVFDLPPEGSPGTSTRNTLAYLLQVGLSNREAAGPSIVSVRITQAELGN